MTSDSTTLRLALLNSNLVERLGYSQARRLAVTGGNFQKILIANRGEIACFPPERPHPMKTPRQKPRRPAGGWHRASFSRPIGL